LDAAEVALEVAVINEIEAQKRWKGSPIRFGNSLTRQVALVRQPLLQRIQPVENFACRLLIGLLRLGKARAVHAVVEMAVNEIVDAVDLVAQSLRVKIVADVCE